MSDVFLGTGERGIQRLITDLTAQGVALPPPVIQRLMEESDRQEQEMEAVYQREQSFRALAENAPDIIARFDRQFRHVYVNPAVRRLTGQASAQCIGKSHRELGLPSALCDLWETKLKEAFGGKQAVSFEFVCAGLAAQQVYQVAEA